MELTREHIIDADPLAVWAALNDDSVLKASIPGCESLERTDPDTIQAVVKVKIGPIGARFSGVVRFSDQRPPHGYKITFEGQGGAAGFAKGHALVDIRPHESGSTILTYEAHAQVGGRLAQIGSRLIDNVAAKTAEDFFTAFSRQLSREPESTPSAEPHPHGLKPSGKPPIRGGAAAPEVFAPQAVLDTPDSAQIAGIRTRLSIIAGSSVVFAAATVVYVLHSIL